MNHLNRMLASTRAMVQRTIAMVREAVIGTDGLAAEKLARLRAEQVSIVVRMTPFMMAANVLSCIVVVLVFANAGHGLFLTGWTILFTAFVAYAVLQWWKSLHRPTPQRVSARAVRRIILSCTIPACLWGFAPIVLFPDAVAHGQLLISSIVLGTLCVGAFGLATVAPAAYVYTTIIGVSALVAMLGSRETGTMALSFLLAVYIAIVWFSINWFSRLFNSNVLRAMELSEQKELIGLLLHDFQENASDWLWEVDDHGRLTMVSPRFLDRVGLAEADIVGHRFERVLAGDGGPGSGSSPHQIAALNRLFAAQAPFASVEIAVNVKGQIYWWELSGKPVHDVAGRFCGFRGVGSDITASKRSQQKMAHMAHHDSLTGLPNRVLVNDSLASRLARSVPLSLLMLDLDNFKSINDTLGHIAGDAILVEVARRLRDVVPPEALVSRLGGDEFAIVLFEAVDEAGADPVAARIVAAMAEPFLLGGGVRHIGGSVGIALAPRDGRTPEDLFRRADLALYEAKAHGRNTHRFFVSDLEASARERRALEDDLREAVASQAFELYYQPIVDLETEMIVGAEALLRWRHPVRGPIAPVQFIPIAEDTGLIVPLGAWAIDRACRDAASWPGHLTVAVNVSVAQMGSARLQSVIVKALSDHHVVPSRLEIEVTESMLADREVAKGVLAQWKSLGVTLALDDFGTGYSSLSYLRNFPFDKLKIDQSFVRQTVGRSDVVAIVNAIAGLSRELGLVTVAEGIETEAELAIVRAAGCMRGQGYHFARPMPAADFHTLVWSKQSPALARSA